ncbi:MAG: hypothetical protein ACTHJ0_10150 [Flavipsychrobacter sp.]
MIKKMFLAALLCSLAGFTNAQTVSAKPLSKQSTSNSGIDPATGRASFVAKMDKAPTAHPAQVASPAQRPGFRAVMDKKPSAPTGK